jgi:hypothetical protein
MKKTLDKFKTEDLQNFVELCGGYIDIDKDKFFTLASNALSYYKGSKNQREQLREYQEIESRWYNSLAAGNPDYSVYDDPYMLVEVWACWCMYSRKYISLIDKENQTEYGSLRDALGDIQSIADIGCGCAYTTAAWKEAYPNATVIGTQVTGSPQFEIATNMGAEHGFTIIGGLESHADLVFASEYFEHWEAPVEHLEEVLAKATPNALVIANAFGSKSVGHFDIYKDRGVDYNPKAISRKFNQCLRNHGYKLVQTKFWNGRPTVWIKNK